MMFAPYEHVRILAWPLWPSSLLHLIHQATGARPGGRLFHKHPRPTERCILCTVHPCTINLIGLLIPYPFLWLGRESCWLTGLPQCPPLLPVHVSSLCLKRISLPSLSGAVLYAFPAHRGTEWSKNTAYVRRSNDWYAWWKQSVAVK